MRLSELNPSFTPVDEGFGTISFDNPVQAQIKGKDRKRWARIRSLPIIRNGLAKPKPGPIWTYDGSPETGDWDSLSIQPSIWFMQGEGAENGEWHGFITNGEVK